MYTDNLYHSLRGLYQLPEFMFSKEDNYVIIEGSELNIQKWNEYISNHSFNMDKINIYFYDPEDYKLCLDKLIKESEEMEEQARQEKINNPKVSEKITNISSVSGLINFLLDEYKFNAESNIEEFSVDKEVSYARLNAEMKHLNELKNNLL